MDHDGSCNSNRYWFDAWTVHGQCITGSTSLNPKSQPEWDLNMSHWTKYWYGTARASLVRTMRQNFWVFWEVTSGIIFSDLSNSLSRLARWRQLRASSACLFELSFDVRASSSTKVRWRNDYQQHICLQKALKLAAEKKARKRPHHDY